MTDQTEAKNACRQWVRQEQKKLPQTYRKTADAEICKKILALPYYRQARSVLFFVSKQNEVQTAMLLRQAWEDGKRVLVPRCAETGNMDVYIISSMQDLEKGQYGICEPKAYCMGVEKGEIDFAIIPCMSADKYGNRLGYGGGYYDRYLVDTVFPKAVICYARLLLPKIPVEVHDCRMDVVITEEDVWQISI